jgi:hypothetical protein
MRHILHVLVLVILLIFHLVLADDGWLTGLEILLIADPPPCLVLPREESAPEVLTLLGGLVSHHRRPPQDAKAHLLA